MLAWCVFVEVVLGDYLIADRRNDRVQLCPDAPGFPCETVAGTGQGGFDATHLRSPEEVVVADDGDYIIADAANRRIQRCPAAPPGSACETVVGGFASGDPTGVAVDADGALVVTEYYNHRVLRCVPASPSVPCEVVAGTGVAGEGATELYLPIRTAIDAAKNYVIADSGNHRIQRCLASSPGSHCETLVGTGVAGSSAAELNNPRGLTFDDDGHLLIADGMNHRIQRCPVATAGSDCETVVGGSAGQGLGELNYPNDIAINGDGRLLIADFHNNRVLRCFVVSAKYLCEAVIGGLGTGATELNGPASVEVMVLATTTPRETSTSRTSHPGTVALTTVRATAALASRGSAASWSSLLFMCFVASKSGWV